MMLRIEQTLEITMQRAAVEVNGITLSYLEEGDGPVLLLCHGFPETAHAWHQQIPVLASAGYRVLAPDLRGYGASSAPLAVDAYTVFHAVGDLVGLLDALSIDHAIIVGADWGATIAWQMALMRPDRTAGIVALGVPMMARSPAPPTELFPRTDDALFYTLYFQAPGIPERELELDIPATLRKIYHGASGSAGLRCPGDCTPNPFGMVAPARGMLHDLPEPDRLHHWLSSSVNASAASFRHSGFRGGLNYYRNLDRNWALQASLDGMQVNVPALFAIGSRDVGLSIPGMDGIIADMHRLVPRLQETVTVEGAGHWLHQEEPDVVNDLILSLASRVWADTAA
jgi:pimeloyl-ACP methyl ester carboxylesterase